MQQGTGNFERFKEIFEDWFVKTLIAGDQALHEVLVDLAGQETVIAQLRELAEEEQSTWRD